MTSLSSLSALFPLPDLAAPSNKYPGNNACHHAIILLLYSGVHYDAFVDSSIVSCIYGIVLVPQAALPLYETVWSIFDFADFVPPVCALLVH